MAELNCGTCTNVFSVWPFKLKAGKGKFCSRSCYAESLKGKKHTQEHKGKISASLQGVVNAGQFKKGIVPPTAFKKGHIMSVESRIKIGAAEKGEKHWNWKGGISPVNELLRNCVELRLWRKAVFERDNFTCQAEGCGAVGVTLNADHIKPFSLYPELRFAIDNGRTLCVPCHKKTETYGAKIRNYERA